MKRYFYRLLLIAILTVMASCTPNVTQWDFIGTWRAPDGCTLILKEDGTYIARGVEESDFFGEPDSDTYKWKYGIDDYYKESCVYITMTKWAYTFYVSGSGLLGVQPPYYFYDFIGDPDDWNLYEFHRISTCTCYPVDSCQQCE